ncbi:MAG: hypothetical protein U9P80_08990 [Thermodesulfobacteriota bacterium]|nr:hypothetical protein [Thermodesulfobacteriota bacterium]
MKRLWITGMFVLLLPLGLMAQGGISEADALYDKGGLENFKKATGIYETVLEKTPDSYEAAWKAARAFREYGNQAKEDNVTGWKDICKNYGKKGMETAKKAIDIDSTRVEGHFYYGLSVGVYSDGVSILTALKEGLKNKTQDGFERAYAIDKRFEDCGPIIALGRFWQVLPWPLNDKKDSLKYYREAQQYQPDNPELLYFLSELLLDMRRKHKKEAMGLLEKVSASDDAYFSGKAKKLLAEEKS